MLLQIITLSIDRENYDSAGGQFRYRIRAPYKTKLII